MNVNSPGSRSRHSSPIVQGQTHLPAGSKPALVSSDEQDARSSTSSPARTADDQRAQSAWRKRVTRDSDSDRSSRKAGKTKKAKLAESQASTDVKKFKLEDMKEAIKIFSDNASLNRFFPYPPQELKEIFGCENQRMLHVDTSVYADPVKMEERDKSSSATSEKDASMTDVHTSLPESTEETEDENSVESDYVPPEKGQISFTALYGIPAENSNEKVIVVALRGYRDPELGDLSGSDIIQQQMEFVNARKPDLYVLKDISSLSGLDFFHEHHFSHKDLMPPEVFVKFMDKTVNGAAARKRLERMGLEAESAQVIRYLPKGHFSVVLKTAPLKSHPSE